MCDPTHAASGSEKEAALPVAMVRRNLGALRKLWRECGPTNPLYLCEPLEETTVGEFAYAFVASHHRAKKDKG